MFRSEHSLLDRHPATAVIQTCLIAQDAARKPSTIARVLGFGALGDSARPWYSRALGERETAEALSRLPADWTTLHSVPIGSGASDIDHVAIGPTGVFTITTRHRRGARVSVGDDITLINGTEQTHRRRFREEADIATRALSTAVGFSVPVTAIVSVVGAARVTDSRSGDNRDVVVMRVAQLDDAVTHGAPVMTREQVRTVVAAAALPATWHESVGTAPDPDAVSRFDALVDEVDTARRRRVLWLVAAALVVTLGAIELVLSVAGAR